LKPETKKHLKKIAVVILNWNGAKLLEQFLPSVVEFSDEATIYVADNASTDDSIEVIKSQFPSVKIIQNGLDYFFRWWLFFDCSKLFKEFSQNI
jgi:GT2 family glycosyltransferase